jgi:hypothetical protein
MIFRALVVLVATAGGAAAQSWEAMSGPDIAAALTDQVVIYEDAKQKFFASGRTLYTTVDDSWGTWAVRGDQYCSTWPPSGSWGCYDMTRDGLGVRFVDAYGNVSEGKLGN